jgi:hypothetical protein
MHLAHQSLRTRKNGTTARKALGRVVIEEQLDPNMRRLVSESRRFQIFASRF